MRNMESKALAALKAIKPPHRSFALTQSIYGLVERLEDAYVPSHPRFLPSNLRKLAEVEAHLKAALQLIQKVTAAEEPRVPTKDGDVAYSRSERRYFRQRDAAVAKLKEAVA